MSTATSSRMTSTISQNSPFPPNTGYQHPSQNSSYPQIPRNSSFQHQQYHQPIKQVQDYSSSSSSLSSVPSSSISSVSSAPSSVSSASSSSSFSLGSLPPSFDRSHLIDGIPVTYILEKLHLLGSTLYNDKQTAYAELHINSLPN